jgi:hypothetical protein
MIFQSNHSVGDSTEKKSNPPKNEYDKQRCGARKLDGQPAHHTAICAHLQPRPRSVRQLTGNNQQNTLW